MSHQEQKNRRQDQGQKGDQSPGQTQVCARNGREIIVICLVCDGKEADGKNHGGRRIVHQNDDASFQYRSGRGIRPLCKTKSWKWIIPGAWQKKFCQAFLVHGQGIRMDVLNPFSEQIQAVFIILPFHVTEDDVSVRTVPCIQHLHMKPGGADTSADQCRVKNNGFHETVPGTPEGPVFQRLLNSPGRIGTAVDGQASFYAGKKQTGHAGQQIMNHTVHIFQNFCLHIRKESGLKSLRRGGKVFRFQAVEIFQDLFQNLIFYKSVNKEQAGALSADDQPLLQNVKIVVDAEQAAEICDVCCVVV